ncbi:hypothetical protein O9992_28635 [Vibrio lentus]|nr:hypothetical protein [Vibrio lentus]
MDEWELDPETQAMWTELLEAMDESNLRNPSVTIKVLKKSFLC